MKSVLIGVLLVLYLGCRDMRKPDVVYYRHVWDTSTTRVKDKLLKLHPKWQAKSHGSDGNTFSLRGYLLSRPDAEIPQQPRVLSALEKPPRRILDCKDVPELDEANWRGVVYLRGTLEPNGETPGIYEGRVLIRADCLFYGDKEMLKQIDKDLQVVDAEQ